MQKVFFNLLVPVKLDNRTDESVEKAIAFANKLECNVHLLYTAPSWIRSDGTLKFRSRKSSLARKKLQLSALADKYIRLIRPGSLLITSFREGNAGKEMVEYALSKHIDMICLGDRHYGIGFRQFNIHKLAADSGCAVFIGNQYSGFRDFEKIVLPIGHYMPVNRIRIATYLAQQLHAAIHLVTVGPQYKTDKNLQYLRKTYQLLKENTNLPLVCSSIQGYDPGHSALDYAQNVNAGLIVANTGETSWRGNFFRKILPSFFLPKPGIPVLLVE
jgi:hypothetical protein